MRLFVILSVQGGVRVVLGQADGRAERGASPARQLQLHAWAMGLRTSTIKRPSGLRSTEMSKNTCRAEQGRQARQRGCCPSPRD